MQNDIDQKIQDLKEQEKNSGLNTATVIPHYDEPPARRRRHRQRDRRSSPSLFGPILLIAFGSYFLASNLNIIDGHLYWEAVFRVWPLFLIFAGVNIIARQLPGALGSLMSGLVGLVAAATFAAILLFADRLPFFSEIASAGSAQINTAVLSQSLDSSVDSGRITIDGNAFPISIDGQAAADNLIDGEVDYVGDLVTDYEVARGQAIYLLEMRNNSWPWSTSGDHRWEIHLTDDLPLDLHLDLGSGSSSNDLSALQLIDLSVEGGSGSSETRLANGNYQIEADMGSGASRFTLPTQGEVTLDLEGGSGSVQLYLPSSMDARIEVEDGSGSFSPGGRLQLVDGERNGDGVWQTEGYDEDDPNRIDIKLDIGSGSVSITNE